MAPIDVLHVDEPGVTEETAEILEDENDRLDVETAHTASGALDCIDEEDAAAVDCVVSGYDIPGGDGLELLNAVRETYPDLPFVLFASEGNETVASEAISQGVDGYLRRDAEADQHSVLANRVESAVDQHRARQRVERLHEVTRTFMRARSREAVCEAAVDAVEGVLAYPLSTVWLLEHDEDGRVLRPVAASEQTRQQFEELPVYTPGNSLSWQTFEAGEPDFYPDVDRAKGVYDPDTAVRSEMILPLGEHGVMNVGTTREREIGRMDRSLANLLAANVEAALDRAAREEERVRNERELERGNERLEEFVSVVAHDLRNPLNVATGRLELAAEECQSRFLDDVADAHDRMEALIEDLLTFAREGETVEDARPLSLPAIARDAWKSAGTTGVDLAVETEATVLAEPQRLRCLFENLFRNVGEHAIGSDATESHSEAAADTGEQPPTEVTVTVGDIEGGFFVADDGVGIPPEKREKVFESGYTISRDGTGFGLSIVQQIAAAHDWKVDLLDSAAGGARFEFTGVETEP